MTANREKGKIPRTEWPKILALYGSGLTIAEIGRRYGCSAPAIRYIVKRNGMLRGGASGKTRPADAAGRTDPKGADKSATSRHAELPHFEPSTGLPSRDVLGPNLRRRLSGAIASFLVSLDQAIVSGSSKSLLDLVEATDVLMRSAARTRIEIERRLAGGITSDATGDTFDNAATRMSTQTG